MIINLLPIENSITLRNNNYEGWLYFMIEVSWLANSQIPNGQRKISVQW